jgi:hypothetical protein
MREVYASHVVHCRRRKIEIVTDPYLPSGDKRQNNNLNHAAERIINLY